MMGEPVLCYVDCAWAYFTTQRLEDQKGLGWADTTECHCCLGAPHEFTAQDGEKGKVQWSIVKVAWEGPFTDPCGAKDRKSVQRINSGECPWLCPSSPSHNVAIQAGTPLSRFVELVTSVGGTVYLPHRG